MLTQTKSNGTDALDCRVQYCSLDAYISFRDLVRSAAAHALPQIEIVRPKMVLLSQRGFQPILTVDLDQANLAAAGTAGPLTRPTGDICVGASLYVRDWPDACTTSACMSAVKGKQSVISRRARSCRPLPVRGFLYERELPRRVAAPCPRLAAACHFRVPQ